ncbi:unnamed protein product [Mytilus coruscus]|uniref:Uncharacterized protein n=1 Tax=Mytilus coruscus TaxID=42192 RepID=A0A6J7ZUK9_MYTCO|nr:unnamed protein product [Mytilus coruscus]
MDAPYQLFVVAIHIGNTYTGYAFSIRSEPNNIHMCEWNGLQSYKAPTSVLLNQHQEFLAFGYDAEDRYMDYRMSLENDSDDEKDVLYYFRRFKLALLNKVCNTSETADIAVHQQHPYGFLEEVVPPSGGPWGCIAIDDAFLLFLENVFGTTVMKNLQLTDLDDYTKLINEFKFKKTIDQIR